MKKVLIVLGCIALAFTIVAGVFAIVMGNGLDATEELQIVPVHASALADGTYEGEYEAGRFSNRVAVTVEGGRITGISVTKPVTFERPEITRALVDSVIAKQNTDVDVQSGATVTSKAYLKSIEDAINGK